MKCVKRVPILFLLWRVSLGFVSVHPMEPPRRSVDAHASNKRLRVTNKNGRGPTGTSTHLFASQPFNDTEDFSRVGRLEELKQREQELAAQLASVRREKLSAIRSRPLTIGVVGFGRFGQFIARTFAKYGRVIVTSRSDYTEIANGMGVKYVPLDDPDKFLTEGLDVIVFAVSILSFKHTVKSFAPHIEKYVKTISSDGTALSSCRGPLVVDVLSVKGELTVLLLCLLLQHPSTI